MNTIDREHGVVYTTRNNQWMKRTIHVRLCNGEYQKEEVGN